MLLLLLLLKRALHQVTAVPGTFVAGGQSESNTRKSTYFPGDETNAAEAEERLRAVQTLLHTKGTIRTAERTMRALPFWC